MAKNLVIVESPAKKKIIQGYLGKDFLVESSIGHIRDLPKKGGAIDIENNFQPTYVISEDKKKVVSELKNAVKRVDKVWLATDEDREGEAIAWHLTQVLELKEEDTKRIVFNEITKKAILHAVKNPRALNINLVNSQQARRVLDRLVGFELSPVLWKKVRRGLSAGRVQSVAVRLLVEREKEIQKFKSDSSYKIIAFFINQEGKIFKAELAKRLADYKSSLSFLEKCKKSQFIISSLEKKEGKKSPAAPFTTSTLQQEASRKLGFSVSKTMMVAQRLYEAGQISYMRTDSVNLSDDALNAAQEQIVKLYGEKYSYKRYFTKKSKGAQEAHEAIRPSYMKNRTLDGDSSQKRLYELIWKRTIASQMSDTKLERTIAHIDISNNEDEYFVARGEVIIFDGFMKVYTESKDDIVEEEKGLLPVLQVKEVLKLDKSQATEQFSRSPARYAEASLVRKMEELGIGRPSTYAATITTIQKRGYVEKDSRDGIEKDSRIIELKQNQIKESIKKIQFGVEKSKLFPTDTGIVVNDFLVENFSKILDYGFTASVETEFDQIAEGNKVWNQMIASFYNSFHEKVEDVTGNAERVSGERLLGKDPKTDSNVYARIGPFGPMVQLGDKPESEKGLKPKFASLLKGQTIQEITLEEALNLFKLPRIVGEFNDSDVVAAIGKYGPYLRYNGKFTSIKKSDNTDPFTITIDKAIELIEAKIKLDNERIISSFEGDPYIQVLNGRYGPFIQITINDKKINIKIPKDRKPDSLNREECLSLMKEQQKKNK